MSKSHAIMLKQMEDKLTLKWLTGLHISGRQLDSHINGSQHAMAALLKDLRLSNTLKWRSPFPATQTITA